MIEAKGEGVYSMAEAQLLGYMGCLYREREARGTREDSSIFGIVTDGGKWGFFMLDHQGASGGAGDRRAHVPVRKSPVYEIFTKDVMRTVLGMVIYILQRGAALLTPHVSPVDGKDDARSIGSI